MLYLAQVQKQGLSGKLGLRLLAHQQAEYSWILIAEQSLVSDIDLLLDNGQSIPLYEGLLVLAKLSSDGKIERLENAVNWVLDIVRAFLSNGITPAFLQQEAERAEQWRQTLTLQTQELSRRSLEVEARREQIQALEESFRRDQEGNNPTG